MNEVCINCENGKININEVLFHETMFSAKVFIASDWYQAKINFEVSKTRIMQFLEGLQQLISNSEGTLNFINDEGNFDLNISLDISTGKACISGVLIKEMMDEARLEYSLESDYNSLENFRIELQTTINSLLS